MSEVGDLFLLVADRDIEQTVVGLLSRPQALGIRRIVTSEVRPFPRHDGGCRSEGVSVLRTVSRQFRHAILMFDFDGSGATNMTAAELEQQLEGELMRSGWENNGAVVVIDPEIETWVWSPSREVDQILGWGADNDLRQWLESRGFLQQNRQKPSDPKAAMRAALRQARKKPSAAIFRQLASRVSFRGCTDPGFVKFKSTLQTWFPET